MQQSSVTVESRLISPLKAVVRDLNKLESSKNSAINTLKKTLSESTYQDLLNNEYLRSVPEYKDYRQKDNSSLNENLVGNLMTLNDPLNRILVGINLVYRQGEPDRYKSMLQIIDKANHLMDEYSETCIINPQNSEVIDYLKTLFFVEKFVVGAKQEIQLLIGDDDQKRENELGDNNQNEDHDNDEEDRKEEGNIETRRNVLEASKNGLNAIINALNTTDAEIHQYLINRYGKDYWNPQRLCQFSQFVESTSKKSAWNRLGPDEGHLNLLVSKFVLEDSFILRSGESRRIAENRLNGQEAFLLYDHPEIEKLILILDVYRSFGRVEFYEHLIGNAIRYTRQTMLNFKQQISSVQGDLYSTNTIIVKKRRFFSEFAKKMFQTVINKVDQFIQELSNNIDDEEKNISLSISNSTDEEESKNPINLTQEKTNQTHSILQHILQYNTNTRESFNYDLILNQENIDLTQEKTNQTHSILQHILQYNTNTRESFNDDLILNQENIDLTQEQTSQTHSISQDILQDNTNTREPFNNDLILNQENIDLTQEKGGKKRLTRQSFSQDAFLETKEEKEPIDLEVLETKSQDHSEIPPEIPPQVSKLKINIAIGLMMFSVFLAIIFFTPIAHKLLVNFGKQVGSPLGLHLALAILLGAAFTAGAVLLWLAYKQAYKADEMHQNNRQLLINNANNMGSRNLNGLHQALINYSNTRYNQTGQTRQFSLTSNH